MGQLPMLSKSRYMAGQQCHKRLYLECFHRQLATPVSPQSKARFDEGQKVGTLARALRPGGVLIEADHLHPLEAIEATARAIANPDVPAIYEAAFQFQDIIIRVDILARTSVNSFEFIEVKSNASVKPEHKPDLGIQLWVLEGAGLKIERAILAHLNDAYKYPGGAYDVYQLFTLVDLTLKSRAYQGKYVTALQEMRECLNKSEAPAVDVGPHCKKPHDCNFLAHCRAALPAQPIEDLYQLKVPQRKQLAALGVKTISEIPTRSELLTDIQKRICQSILTDRPFLNKQVKARLRAWGLPLHFLDFEAIAPALPLYAGTSPYLEVPFQWSLHTLRRDGSLEHREFLYEGTDDPRPQLTKELLEAVGSEGRVVHYAPYEVTILNRLKAAAPQLAQQLEAVKSRLADLAPEIRDHYYHPIMQGSFSLKAVYPTLVPGEGYENQKITDGMMASQAFLKMLQPDTTESLRSSIRDDLLSYCRLDTEATVKIYRTLARI